MNFIFELFNGVHLDCIADVSDVLTMTILKDNLSTQLSLYVLGAITPVTGFTVLLKVCESLKSPRTYVLKTILSCTDLLLNPLRKWREGN